MKNLVIITSILIMLLVGCSSIDSSNYKDASNSDDGKEKLKQCYEEKCDLVIGEENERIELPYPFEPCYYESRKGCVELVSSHLSSNFCNNFTYKFLCYEDLAVLKEDIEICNYGLDDETEILYQEQCKDYYNKAVRAITTDNSHCESLSQSNARRCYIDLIAEFKTVEECDKYRDLLKHENYGVDNYFEVPFNQCYWWYAATHDDIDVCMKLENREQRDECLIRYSNAKKDSTFCQNIEHPTVKEVCMRDAGSSGTSHPKCAHTHEFGEVCFGEYKYD